MLEPGTGRIKSVHPHAWIWEPLEAEPSFVLRTMFGAKAVYLGGKLVLCFAAKTEPWRGVLVCTEKRHHESLKNEFPSLSEHPVLPKWLYLPESADDFEAVAERLVGRVRNRDPRIGVIPSPRKSKSRGGR
ncbi:MAG TPA: hypothetical protein VMI53_02220 [Opitutaceae bacterium]|nr:hypothetical protein [Opitutaceae bacterium]